MNIQELSNQYVIRQLFPADAAMVCEILKDNSIFYQYHPPMVSVQSILEDMEALPPHKSYEDKHYIGFFSGDTLVAVMDIIEHYPRTGTAMLCFFAVNTALQGRGTGTRLIGDSVIGLKKLGFEKVRLGIDKGNPQSKAFWLKNGFAFTGEEDENAGVLVMERSTDSASPSL